MGAPSETPLVKPIVGLLAASIELLDDARDVLHDRFAPIEMCSDAVPWDVSRYYREEMGDEIWRQYVAMHDLEPADELVAQKIGANQLEGCWRTSRGRQVNIDPGYVNLSKLVLASTKDAAHRVYLGDGVFAEATLQFVSGSFEAWPYTYRDYASEHAVRFFNRVRERCREQLAARSGRAER